MLPGILKKWQHNEHKCSVTLFKIGKLGHDSKHDLIGTIPEMKNPKFLTSIANTYNSRLVGLRENE